MIPNILLYVSFLYVSSFSLLGQNVQDNVVPMQPNTIINSSSKERLTIGRIRIEGAENYDRNAVRAIAGLNEGMVIHIPGDEVSNAIQNLWNEKIFVDVDISIEKREGDMVHLLIGLTSLPTLSRFRFEGINRREADKLREEISLFSGKTITKDLVFMTKSKIQNQKKHYKNYLIFYK